jgi:hypothetical protein
MNNLPIIPTPLQMTPIIAQQMAQLTATINQANQKIKLEKNDIVLNFVLSRSTFDGYKILYTIRIQPMKMVMAGIQIRASQIDMVSLHDAIIQNLDSFDAKYMTLKKFDTLTCEFHFEFDKWFADATNGIVPRTYISKFDQEFRLKIQPPKVIMFDIGRNDFFNYISTKFKKFIINKNKEKLWLGHILPKDFQKYVNIKLAECFDYTYDYQQNRFIVQLKTAYVIGVSYAVGMAVKEIAGRKNNAMKFSERVEKNSSLFDAKKWKEFVKGKLL